MRYPRTILVASTVFACVAVNAQTTVKTIVYPGTNPNGMVGQPTVPKDSNETYILWNNRGGVNHEHRARFYAIARSGAKVEVRGGCWSACTFITSFIPRAKLCFAEGAFLAFHQSRRQSDDTPNIVETRNMVASYPSEIREWIDRHGGADKMTIKEFWTMYDKELWAMGYPKCLP